MKMLHIINSLGMGGAERMLLDISLLMSENKKDTVEILLLNDRNSPLKYFFEEQKIKVYTLNYKSNYSLLNLYKIIKYMKKYDIIHSHLFPSNYWVSIAKIFLKNKVIVTTEHNTHNRRRNSIFFKYIDKFIYSRYNRVISISDKTQENLLSWLNLRNTEKFIVIENGIDIVKFDNAKAYEKKDFFTNDSFLLVMVGSFSLQKDQETIIKAMKLLPETVKLLLVGEGEKREKIVNLLDKLKLNERVKLLGLRQDVPSILKTSDVAIVSSNWEGFGLVAVEGMASKKPVVASDVDGLKEVVQDFGLIFEKGNEKDLVKKIIQLMNNDYYNDVAIKCFERSKEYSIENLVENYVEVYENVSRN